MPCYMSVSLVRLLMISSGEHLEAPMHYVTIVSWIEYALALSTLIMFRYIYHNWNVPTRCGSLLQSLLSASLLSSSFYRSLTNILVQYSNAVLVNFFVETVFSSSLAYITLF